MCLMQDQILEQVMKSYLTSVFILAFKQSVMHEVEYRIEIHVVHLEKNDTDPLGLGYTFKP